LDQNTDLLESLTADAWSADRRADTLLGLGDRTRDELERWLNGAKKVVHIGYATHANTGDHLILRAEQMMFDDLGVEYVPLPMETFRIPEELREFPLLFKGGGYLGDPGAWHYKKMSRWALRQKAPVLLMPCSAYFKTVDPELWQRTCRWADLTIFSRDITSLAICEEHFPGVARLVPDSAWYSARALKHTPGGTAVLLPRSDRETGGAGLPERYPQVEVREWLEKGVNPDNVFDVIADKFEDVGWLATDRLHVHVAAKILGIRHDFLANSYHKNTAFHATWSAHDPMVRWVE
jgi:exopolysaccharide biosynthesis predicted pyruvyltransferase EpsI